MPALQAQETLTEGQLDMGELVDSLGFLVRLCQVRVYEDFFQDLAKYGVRPGEYSTLLMIGRNPGIRQGQLAQALSVKPAHMTKLIRGFEDRGLVERVIPDNDRRSVELSLTDAGHEFVAARKQAFIRHETRRPDTLTASELETLKHLLRKYAGINRESKS